MSDARSNEPVTRYRPYYFDPRNQTGHEATMRANSDGAYVQWTDYVTLLNENARLRADAERYRWFRDHPGSHWETVSLFQKRPTLVMKFPFQDLDRVPASLDVAVDHARNITALTASQEPKP